MFRKILFLTILLISNYSFLLYPQTNNIRFSRISVKEGLSEPSVSSIAQDSKGFLWFATKSGLNKYDGYSYKIYENDPDNLNSLANNMIQTMYITHTDILWIGTNGGGLDRFDTKTEQFTHFVHHADNPNSISDNLIIAIIHDRSGNLWVGTGDGLNRLNTKTEENTRYFHDPDDPFSLAHNVVRSLHEDKNGNLWIGTYGGLSLYDKNNDHFIHYKFDPYNENSLPANAVMSILEDDKGFLWLGTWPLGEEKGGLVRFDPERRDFVRYIPDKKNPDALGDERIYLVYGDSFDHIWVGTWGGGLYKFDKKTELFSCYKYTLGNPECLSNDIIYSIFEDSTKILWIGTNGGGINKYDYKKEQFGHYQHDESNPNSLGKNQIYYMYADKLDNVWIGTHNGGLDKFNRVNNTFTHYKHDPDDLYSLSNNIVNDITEDHSGFLWVATNVGLNKFDRENERFIRYMPEKNNKNSLSDHIIYSLLVDRQNNLWIGTYNNGLNKFDRKNNKFVHYKHDTMDKESLSNNMVRVIYEDKQGILWVGTNNGLNKFDQGRFFRYQRNSENSISNNVINAIYEDGKGNLWIGTSGGGLNRFNKKTQIFSSYTKKDNLADNNVFEILSDEKGHLWLATGNGLSKFSLDSEVFINYDVEDGLQADYFYCGTRSLDGEMFWGGVNGFNRFYPDNIKKNEHIPPVYITCLKIFNKEVSFDIPLWQKERIDLSWKDTFFSFDFVALDYTAPEKNQYAFKLEGLNKEWIYTKNNRSATFTNLDGGKYVFLVKASNNDNVWNEEGAKINIYISPKPWRSWWAFIIYFLLIAGTVYIIVQVRTRMQKIQLKIRSKELEHQRSMAKIQEEYGKKLEKKIEERTKELKRAKDTAEKANKTKSNFIINLSHEIRTPLNGIMGLAEIINKTNEITQSKKHSRLIIQETERLTRLINLLLDASKLKAGKMKLENEPFHLQDLLKSINSAMEVHAHKKGLKYDVIIDENIPDILKGDSLKISQILVNLIDNAIKFTEKGGITLAIEIKKQTDTHITLFFRIQDTGIGIPEDKQKIIFNSFVQVESETTRKYTGTGLGTAISRQLARLMGGKMSLESTVGKGSTFCFTINVEKCRDISVKKEEPAIITEVHKKLLKNASILLVEDYPTNQRVVIHHLNDAGCHVILAENGKEALEKYKTHSIDLILMDVHMPEMDGYEATRLIRVEPESIRIPIIGMTADAFEKHKKDCLKAGMNDVITKPFRKDHLIIKVAHWLIKRKDSILL